MCLTFFCPSFGAILLSCSGIHASRHPCPFAENISSPSLHPHIVQNHDVFHPAFLIFILHPHLLEVLDDSHVGVHVAVDAVLHAGVLVAGERAGGHAAGDALFEADGVELVDGCNACVSGCTYN